jgi:hypothetical protein
MKQQSEHMSKTTVRLLKTLPALMLCVCSSKSYAACEVKSEKQLQEPSAISEIALANMVIYSQEYMRFFFADNDSDVQPLPASGISLFASRDFTDKNRLSAILTLPLKQEEILRPQGQTSSYYYPKLFMLGFDRDFLQTELSAKRYCFKLSANAGLAFVLSERFTKYQPPYILARSATEVGENVFLNFGIGYSGNIISGAWFFPFGVSYRLSGEQK